MRMLDDESPEFIIQSFIIHRSSSRRVEHLGLDPLVVVEHLQLAGRVAVDDAHTSRCNCRALAVIMLVTGPSTAAATAAAFFSPLASSRILRASRIVPTPIVMA